jgi:hypothetical protein
MNLNDSDLPSQDDPLRQAIARLPLPQTPEAIGHKTRRLVRQRQLRRRALLATSVVAVLLVGLLAWRPWSSPIEQNAIALDAETLEALFAPPPVDSLNEWIVAWWRVHVLDRRKRQ